MGNQTNGKAVASLVLGLLAIVSIFTGWGAFVGFVLAVIGVILGINAKKEMGPGESGRGMATIGIVCSIIGIVFSSIGVICFACLGAAIGISACGLLA